MDKGELIKTLELQKLKLFGKALRQFPSSPRQNATHKEIEKIFAQIEQLRNNNSNGFRPHIGWK